MESSERIQQFSEGFGIPAPEIVDEVAAFDADGMPFFVIAADLGEPPRRGERKQADLLPPDGARDDVSRVSDEPIRLFETVTSNRSRV